MYVQCTYIAGGIFLHNLSPKCFKFSGLYLFLVVSWWEKSYISGFTIDFSMGTCNGNLLKFHHLKIMLVGVKHVLIYENDWNFNNFLTSSIKSGTIFYKSGLDRHVFVCPFHIIYKNQKILKGLAASVHLHKFQWKIKRIESVLKIKFGRSRTNRCVRT